MFYKIFKKIEFNYKISFKFGYNLFYKIKFFLSLFLVSVSKRFFPKIDYSIKLVLKKDGDKNKSFLFYFSDISDFGAFVEIFVNEEYKNNFNVDPRIIFDLGSNSGISALYFKLSYPRAKIFCFEPNPLVFNRLEKNTQQYRNNIFCHNIAIANFDGLEKFYICEKNSLSSSFTKRDSEGEYSEVIVKSIPNLLKELKIDKVDLMKFDVEGAEFKIFEDNFPFFNFKSMIGEIHLDLSDSVIEKDDFLNKFRGVYSSVEVLDISKKRFILKVNQ